MKFKYTGQLPIKDGDLVVAGIFKPNEVLKKGTIFEVPDNDTLLIQRVKTTGNYEEYNEPVKIVTKPKKEQKKEKEDK